MKFITPIAAALLLVLPAPRASAQEAFPSRLITVVNPNAPGGTSDIITRGMTEPLQRALKQTVVTINRVGAGGAVGGAYVAKVPADGYTVLLNTVTHVLIPITETVLGRPAPYSPDDFILLARVTADPLLFVVHPSLPIKTVKELVALARAKPGELTFSSTGLYGSGHISMAMLMRAAKISLLHSPYNGGGPAMTAVLGGHVYMFHAPAGVASPHIASGRVRLIAQTGAKRVPAFPDTPTLKEAGYDAEFILWAGYFAPAKTPPAVARVWTAALRESAADPRFKSAMEKINVIVDYLDGDALITWYEGELKRLDREIRAIGKIESRN
jgi:tripartite-type tricarboxylate transporter receptor subunit TctC